MIWNAPSNVKCSKCRKTNHTTDHYWLLTKKPPFKPSGNHQPQKRQSDAKKQKANVYKLHHELKNKKKGKSKTCTYFTNLELAHFVSIIKLSEEDTMEYSNLHTSSSLDHDEPNYHESITDIVNSFQVEITEEDIEEPVFETWEPQEGFTTEDHGMVWRHDPTQYSIQILNIRLSFLADNPFLTV